MEELETALAAAELVELVDETVISFPKRLIGIRQFKAMR
jgi:hypothetical protein